MTKPFSRRTHSLAGMALLLLLSFSPQEGKTADYVWASFDTLQPGDRAYAEAALTDFWGEDPSLWPDWLTPSVIRVPGGPGNNLLIVRQPLHQPCGQYGFNVIGPVTKEGTRSPLGQRFCGGDLQVLPAAWGQTFPDIVIGGRREIAESGEWKELPSQRWRWVGDGWGLVH